jgi:membrane protease YdiL (CAAX protease family)
MKAQLKGYGIAIGVTILLVALDPYNRIVRNALKDAVGGAPVWADHMFFMLALYVAVAIFLAWLLLGKREAFLASPSRQGWITGAVSGVGLLVVLAVVLALLGQLRLALDFNVPLLFGNVFSNFYEELIYRGIVLGIGVKYTRQEPVAIAMSVIVFSRGHLHYPWQLVLVVIGAGILWAAMTLKYRSLWPAYASHMVSDVLARILFGV